MSGTRAAHKLEQLVFFSDAVFAIAITLLVIEVRLPERPYTTDRDLLSALAALTPRYIGFAISFFVIGRFWAGHHNAFGWLARSDDRLVWRNLLLLFGIAFMPFPTALIGALPLSRVAICGYAGWLALTGVLNLWLLRHALRPALLADDAPSGRRRTMSLSALSPLLIGLGALGFVWWRPVYAMMPLIGSPLRVGWMERHARRRGAY